MLKITRYVIQDKTGHDSTINLYQWRASANDEWQKQPQPNLSTPVWAVAITRKQAATVLLGARKSLWQVEIRKQVIEYQS